MACGDCGRPWIVWIDGDHYAVARGCFCHALHGRTIDRKPDAPYIVTTGATTGGWDWLARVYNDATQ